MSDAAESKEQKLVAAMLLKDRANIAKKLNEGKSLTRAEHLRLQESGNTPPAPGAEKGEAHNQVELAALLGVTRKTIHKWRQLPGAPQPWPNGRWSVLAWREFIAARGLKCQDDTDTNPEEEENIEALKRRKLRADIADRELRNAITRREYVPITEVRDRLAFHIGQATTLLRKKLEDEAPPVLLGLDSVKIRVELGKVVDAFVTTLHGAGEWS